MPCWACRSKHLHEVTITEGKYAGFKGEGQSTSSGLPGAP